MIRVRPVFEDTGAGDTGEVVEPTAEPRNHHPNQHKANFRTFRGSVDEDLCNNMWHPVMLRTWEKNALVINGTQEQLQRSADRGIQQS